MRVHLEAVEKLDVATDGFFGEIMDVDEECRCV